MTVRVEVIATDDALQQFIPEWIDLVHQDGAATPFQWPDITLGLWRVFNPASKGAIIAMRDGAGRLLGVMPFRRAFRRLAVVPVRFLTPLQGWQAYSFDAVVRTGTDVTELLRALHTWPGWTLVECRHLRGGSHLVKSGAAVGARVAIDGTIQDVDLASGAPIMSAAHRRELRRLLRQPSNEGPFVIEAFPAGPDQREALQQFCLFHAERWRDTDTPSAFVDAAVRERFIHWATTIANGRCRLVILRAPAGVRGVLIVLRGRDTDFAWRVGYDTSLSRISPGIQLLTHGMELARADGQRTFELGRGDDAYKNTWITQRQDLYSFRWMRPRAATRLAAGLGGVVRRDWLAPWRAAGNTNR